MERQLKERLVGAAVLIAVAVVMVPEMFSGSGSHAPESQKPSRNAASESSESGQLKTYRIDLQQREPSVASSISSVQTIPSVPDTHADAIASTVPQSDTASSRATESGSSSLSSFSSERNAANVNSSRAASSASSHAMASPANNPEGGWSVQLGSFGAEATAKKIVTDAKSHGFSAFVTPAKVGGKTLYRVRVGPFSDRDAAQVALAKLKRSYAQASLAAPSH